MTKRLTASTLALLVLFLAAAPVARSQPLADRLPADTIVYVGWGGTQSVEGYDASHLKAILEASSLPAVFTEFLPKAIAAGAAAEHDADVQKAAEMIRADWSLLRRRARWRLPESTGSTRLRGWSCSSMAAMTSIRCRSYCSGKQT